jgi:hypothetical protein
MFDLSHGEFFLSRLPQEATTPHRVEVTMISPKRAVRFRTIQAFA